MIQGFTLLLKTGCHRATSNKAWLPDVLITKALINNFGCPVGQPGVNFWLYDRTHSCPGQPVI